MRLLMGGISVWLFWLERGQRSTSVTALAVHLYTTRLHRLRSAGEMRLYISVKKIVVVHYCCAHGVVSITNV